MKALPDPNQVVQALDRLRPGLEKYCWLQANLRHRDVALDEVFQRRFVGFYRVRRNAAWCRPFFELLERQKTRTLSFGAALGQLLASTRRVEASFASKLVATIDPHRPVIDSVVLENVGLRLPGSGVSDRLGRTIRMYAQLENWYRVQLASRDGAKILRLFRLKYPEAKVTDTKALDFVLWQTRQTP